MITPDELIDFAAFDLAQVHTEAAVRRAISAAYYAVFHTVANAGAALFAGSPALQQRIARSYEHKAVQSMSSELERHGKRPDTHPGYTVLANNLRELYEARTRADYDLLSDLTWKDGQERIFQAVEAMQCVRQLASEPAFIEMLLTPLLRDRNRRG